jgi:2-methylcitrate dehydratase PrpD
LLKIMHDHDLKHDDIDEIDAAWQKVEPFLAKHKVSTVVAAQASLPFALAVAAVRGKIGVDEFTDETIADPVVQELVPRTVVHQDSELYGRVEFSMPGRVTVRTKDGREYTDEVLYPKGNPRNPMDETEFKAKFMDLATRVLRVEQSEELYAQARHLEGIANVAELATLFSPR